MEALTKKPVTLISIGKLNQVKSDNRRDSVKIRMDALIFHRKLSSAKWRIFMWSIHCHGSGEKAGIGSITSVFSKGD